MALVSLEKEKMNLLRAGGREEDLYSQTKESSSMSAWRKPQTNSEICWATMREGP